ncbi:MAG: flavin reductase (DIM6/NTAB) family NADH-FMN oxidoreductase RutF [Glaciecola sp.]|jgi:flavin reductase (DIM6/NTAB) family NADH-FMN oxidoreductase RutF|uniref:flavin reductase family protein n=1 Tax=Congregibacter sp. TaxID=2744308 RepID=UPI0039E5926D
MTIDARELRDALGQFATGVCLVTVTDEDGVAHALTVNSFSSVSLDPPLVLWSLQKDAEIYALYESAPRFCIAVLSDAQEGHSSGYAQKGAHRLAAEHFESGLNGAPLITGALVNFECSLERAIDGGDHTILLGRVTRVSTIDSQSPLVFLGGQYRELK